MAAKQLSKSFCMALFQLEGSCEAAIIKNIAIYCQICKIGSSQPSLNISNLVCFQAPTDACHLIGIDNKSSLALELADISKSELFAG